MTFHLFQYIIITLIASTGLFWGFLLRWLTPRELEPGRRYFRGLVFSLAGISYFLVFYPFIGIFAGILPALALGYAAFKHPYHPAIAVALGLALLLSRTTEFFSVVGATCFLYGLPAGSLIEKHSARVIFLFIGFLIATALMPMTILYW